jgi:tRNA(His) 5'-end guanylyltransferase
MASVSASMAAAQFNQLIYINAIIDKASKGITNITEDPSKFMNNVFDKMAFFDSRVWTIPDPIEVENYFVWRQKDAVRNSLSMHAQSLFSHKELNGKSQVDMHDMIHAKGENWDKLPDGFKRGRTIFKSPNSGQWTLDTPDFLKGREIFSTLIPKINEVLTNE